MAATAELLQLIDLSLGEQPCSVVNFNYLQCVLHEIVKRLVFLEDCQQQQQLALGWQPVAYGGTTVSRPGAGDGSSLIKHQGRVMGPSEISLQPLESTDTSPAHSKTYSTEPSAVRIMTSGTSAGALNTGPLPPIGTTAGQPTGTVPGQPTGTAPLPPIGTTPGQPTGPTLTGQPTGQLPGTTPTTGQPTTPGATPGQTTVTGATGQPAGPPVSTQLPTATGQIVGQPTGQVTETTGPTATGVTTGQPTGQTTGPMTGQPTGQLANVPTTGGIPAAGVQQQTYGQTITGQPTTTVPQQQQQPLVGRTTPMHPTSGGTDTTPTHSAGSSSIQSGLLPNTTTGGAIGGTISPSTDIGGTHHTAGTNIPRPRSRASVLTAANDLSALERKIQNLEAKVNSFDSLPEMLERKASDSNATPVSDIWNFTTLNNRVTSAEQGMAKSSQLFDELLGEIQALKQRIKDMESSMNQHIDSLNNKVSASSEDLEARFKSLEALKMSIPPPSDDSTPSEAIMGYLNELQQNLQLLQKDSKKLQERMDSLEKVATDNSLLMDLQESLKAHETKTDSAINLIQSSLQAFAFKESCDELKQQNDLNANKIDSLTELMKQLESSLSEKVNATDLASLMPTSGDGDGMANLMAKLLEMQNKLLHLEDTVSQSSNVPSDLLDRITAMQNAIDHLTNELGNLSGMTGGADSGKVEELGLQLAQVRERLEEMDRAVAALTKALSQQSKVPVQEPTGDYSEQLSELHQMVNGIHEEQERLIGTAAHLSHEIDISKEHTKTLYSEIDQLKARKADKDQVAIEVEEKADRTALEAKASREWVDSTFERLDREIRDAKSHLVGQEEAFKAAVNQINEDVDGKLDRMELEPLRSYFDKKLDRIKIPPPVTTVNETVGDDAAGFRKPLRFRCISCDKPVGLKPNEAVPTLPQIDMLPGVRSFRPYTTYELELIRRQQKMGQTNTGLMVLPPFPATIRSAGGSHTLTRPHQRIRATPFSSVYSVDGTPIPVPPPPPTNAHIKRSPNLHDELDIIGQDGHIYKGRTPTTSSMMPYFTKPRSAGRRSRMLHNRPSTTAMTPQPIQP